MQARGEDQLYISMREIPEEFISLGRCGIEDKGLNFRECQWDLLYKEGTARRSR